MAASVAVAPVGLCPLCDPDPGISPPGILRRVIFSLDTADGDRHGQFLRGPVDTGHFRAAADVDITLSKAAAEDIIVIRHFEHDLDFDGLPDLQV